MNRIFTRKHLFLTLASLPFMGVVAAFGIAPDTPTQNIQRETVVENVALPQVQATDSGAFDFWREERIARGDTLQNLLSRLGVDGEETRRVLATAHKTRSLGHLVPGRSVLARVTSGGQLMLFRYMVSDENLVTVSRAGEGQL